MDKEMIKSRINEHMEGILAKPELDRDDVSTLMLWLQMLEFEDIQKEIVERSAMTTAMPVVGIGG